MSELDTVVIADRHAPTRVGLRLMLEADGFRVLAETASVSHAIRAARELRPRVCVLDVEMPGGGGIHAARRISDELNATKIVILAEFGSGKELVDAVRAGADGYLLKTASAGRLPLAIRAVINGEAALPRTLTPALLDAVRGPNRIRLTDRTVELTAREAEVLDQLREGVPTAIIAKRLYISNVTVRRHLSNALQKLGAADRHAALSLLADAAKSAASAEASQ